MSRVTLNFDLSKFLLCFSTQGQDLYSHQKLNMYMFSSESGYRLYLTDANDDDDANNAGRNSTTMWHIANYDVFTHE